MSGNQTMPSVDPIKDKVSAVDRHYMKKMEEKNLERALQFRKLQKNNRIIGCLLTATALGLYSYTILSFKQERFEDYDFDDVRRK